MGLATGDRDIREFGPERDGCFARLIVQLNEGLTIGHILARLAAIRAAGYRSVGVFSATDEMLAACGMVAGERFYSGRYLHLDNLAVDSAWHGQGLGKTLMQWVEAEALAKGYDSIVLDAYVTNAAAHRFYFRRGYHIKGFHFYKAMAGQ